MFLPIWIEMSSCASTSSCVVTILMDMESMTASTQTRDFSCDTSQTFCILKELNCSCDAAL